MSLAKTMCRCGSGGAPTAPGGLRGARGNGGSRGAGMWCHCTAKQSALSVRCPPQCPRSGLPNRPEASVPTHQSQRSRHALDLELQLCLGRWPQLPLTAVTPSLLEVPACGVSTSRGVLCHKAPDCHGAKFLPPTPQAFRICLQQSKQTWYHWIPLLQRHSSAVDEPGPSNGDPDYYLGSLG